MCAIHRLLGNAARVIIASLFLASACPESEAADPAARVRERLDDILAGELAMPVATAGPGEDAALASFYAARDSAPVWIAPDVAAGRARILLEALRAADAEGLQPEVYALDEIGRLLAAGNAGRLVRLELLLSRELLRFARHLRHGRVNPEVVDPALSARPGMTDGAAILRGAAESDNLAHYLKRLAPASPAYRRLRRALAAYRAIAASGGWPAVPDEGQALKPGMRGPGVGALRRHLRAIGDLSVRNHDPALFDAALELAVQRYQARHGLEADGVVGRRTRAALNTSVAERIRRIEINMERWRWMPDDLGDRYLLVNLAGFEAELVEYGATTLRLRAVVGRTYRKTPVFSDRMTYLEFNPTWTIPPTIVREDLIPKLRADVGYLAEQGIAVYAGWSADAPRIDPADVDWDFVDARRMPYRFVQAPGPKNPLGRVKFMFPNRFHVYIHDTPQPELFERPVRSFSSGCIRIDKPMDLAARLLAGHEAWDMNRVAEALDSGRTVRARLSRPLPVHLTYSTVWIGEGGTIHFRDDVYGRDSLLDAALKSVERTGATTSGGETGQPGG